VDTYNNKVSANSGANTFTIPVGAYTPANLATVLQNYLTGNFFTVTWAVSFDTTALRFNITESNTTYQFDAIASNPLLAIMGWTVTPPVMVATVAQVAPFAPNMNELSQFYIQLDPFEPRIVFPSNYAQSASFAVDVTVSEGNRMVFSAADDLEQVAFMASAYPNNLLKITLIRPDGTLLNVNNVDWTLVLRIEDLEDAMFH